MTEVDQTGLRDVMLVSGHLAMGEKELGNPSFQPVYMRRMPCTFRRTPPRSQSSLASGA